MPVPALLDQETSGRQTAGDNVVNRILLAVAHRDETVAELKQARMNLRRTAHKLAPRDVQALTDRIYTMENDVAALRARIKDAASSLGTADARRLREIHGYDTSTHRQLSHV